VVFRERHPETATTFEHLPVSSHVFEQKDDGLAATYYPKCDQHGARLKAHCCMNLSRQGIFSSYRVPISCSDWNLHGIFCA
jgi:hypothetical protein